MIEFPKDFLWGAAISAYQTEGNNLNSDWWDFEKKAGLKDASGLACRHYEFFREDFALASLLNLRALRLSIEWSRIEPQAGQFCEKEIEHYREVVSALRERNLEPVVTLHHFTNPLWFARLGGWQNKKSTDYFLRYVEKITLALCGQVRFWVTINEPMVYIYHSFILGFWPPQEKSFFKALQARNNLIKAHIKTYRLIQDIYQRKNLAKPLISIANSMQAFVPCSRSLKNRIAVYLREKYFNHVFLDQLSKAGALDFLGINYYTRSLVDVERWGLRNLFLDICKKNHSLLPKNSLGWDIYPEGMYSVLLGLAKYRLPVFILENGICTDDDSQRWDFIRGHLKSIYLAMQKGVKVWGYLYWSLLDNFEWDKGFIPRFGLIEVDYATYKRKPRDSAREFAAVCKTGRLDLDAE
ncbi:MAG: glycoside hydrolase family 1 protein [Candidatus Omnitrophica bacterium]|nr:glycoside hydrolase family 1 protein [Candidatus Omnitrophota bacterium]